MIINSLYKYKVQLGTFAIPDNVWKWLNDREIEYWSQYDDETGRMFGLLQMS